MGCDVLYISYSLQPSPQLPLCNGGWVIFEKVYKGGTQVKLGFLVRVGTLGRGVGDFLQVWLENPMYKNSEYKSQTKKLILIPNIFFVGAKWLFCIL